MLKNAYSQVNSLRNLLSGVHYVNSCGCIMAYLSNDDDVFIMMEQNGFTGKELKCISHPQAQFKSYKLAVPRSEFNKLFDENLWPKGVCVRTYWSQKQGSK